jgi:hypothetical protein
MVSLGGFNLGGRGDLPTNEWGFGLKDVKVKTLLDDHIHRFPAPKTVTMASIPQSSRVERVTRASGYQGGP